MANQILITMVACGKEEMKRGQFELALDHFSELLELLYFKIFPGVLLMKAECLLKLVRKQQGFVFPVSSQNIITKEFGCCTERRDQSRLSSVSLVIVELSGFTRDKFSETLKIMYKLNQRKMLTILRSSRHKLHAAKTKS